MNLYLKDRKDLSGIETEKLMELLIETWPPKEGEVDLEKMIDGHKNANLNSFSKVLLCFNEDQLIGHTEIFNREIVSGTESWQIMALAGVCVKPDFRGKNIGYKLVKRAFEFVDNGRFDCSIFQTNVPGFYEKLNCRQIHNTFINSKNKNDINENPWRDPYVMVYPKAINLPEGIIDLNGDGY